MELRRNTHYVYRLNDLVSCRIELVYFYFERKFMKIKASELSDELLSLIENPDPLAGEDILIENGDGHLIGAILQPKAYEFFVRKIEEKEDESDSNLNEAYDENSMTLDDLKEENS